MPDPEGPRTMPRWLPHPHHDPRRRARGLLYRVPLEGAVGLGLLLALPNGRADREGQVPRTDPYSFTWFGMPWTLHEWLSELFLFSLVNGIGYMGAVYVFALIPAYHHRHPGLRAPQARAANPGGHRRDDAVGPADHPLRHRPAPGGVVDLLRALIGGLVHLRPDRARWVLLPGAAVRRLGQPPRAVGHRPRGAGRLRNT